LNERTLPPRGPNRLKEWREARGLTQEQLAQAAETTPLVIANFEQGQRGMSDRWLLVLSRALNIDRSELVAAPAAPEDASAELLAVWSRIPEHRRRQALAMLRSMATR
jgi:transcriptional regulator with XRE-family HTH domain